MLVGSHAVSWALHRPPVLVTLLIAVTKCPTKTTSGKRERKKGGGGVVLACSLKMEPATAGKSGQQEYEVADLIVSWPGSKEMDTGPQLLSVLFSLVPNPWDGTAHT